MPAGDEPPNHSGGYGFCTLSNEPMRALRAVRCRPVKSMPPPNSPRQMVQELVGLLVAFVVVEQQAVAAKFIR